MIRRWLVVHEFKGAQTIMHRRFTRRGAVHRMGRQHFSKRAERDLRLILAKLDGRGE